MRHSPNPTVLQLTLVAATLAAGSEPGSFDAYNLALRAHDLWQACERELKQRHETVPTKPPEDDLRVSDIMRKVNRFPAPFRKVARIVIGGEREDDRTKLLRDYLRDRAERDFFAENPRRRRLGRFMLSDEQREEQAATSIAKMKERGFNEMELKHFASDFIDWRDAHDTTGRSDKASKAAKVRWARYHKEKAKLIASQKGSVQG